MGKIDDELKKAQEELKMCIMNLNANIEVLGTASGFLYEGISDLQKQFDLIRGIPSDIAIKYAGIKKISEDWKISVEKIEEDYRNKLAKAGGGAGGGVAVGIGVFAFGPSVAMGVATTFGVASTGTAISALSGAAATNAALAWLGGGALAAGGGGMAAGQAFLALAGPVGWVIGGTALVIAGTYVLIKRSKMRRLKEIFLDITKRDIAKYRLATIEIEERTRTLYDEASQILQFLCEIRGFGTEYVAMTEDQQYRLGVFVNFMSAAIQNLTNPIQALIPKFTIKDVKISAKCAVVEYDIKERLMNLILFFANLLYGIKLNEEKDIPILYEHYNNKKFLEAFNLKKKQFTESIIRAALKLIKKKYPV